MHPRRVIFAGSQIFAYGKLCVLLNSASGLIVHLQSLSLTHWKNFTSGTLAFAERLVLFSGLNGMGKTNLLDAIYFLCMTRSYFGLRERLLVQQGADFFRLDARFARALQAHRVVAKVVPGKKKVFEVDGVARATLAEHLGHFPVVMVAPSDIQLAYEGSEARRKLIDAALAQADKSYLHHLIQYARLLRHRNRLLRQMAERPPSSFELLDTLDAQLAAPGRALHQRRKAYVARLEPLIQHFYQIVSEGREAVSCTYKSQLLTHSLPALLEMKRQQDLALGYSTAGLHRDDLDFRIDGRPLKQFASQGQLKSFILALKLAQYQVLTEQGGCKPLLLLDDLFDKLDERRVARLLQLLLAPPFGQIFITDTHRERIPSILRSFGQPFEHYAIRHGQAVPAARKASTQPTAGEDE